MAEQDQTASLRQSIEGGVVAATAALKDLTSQLAAYDEEHKLTEGASQYMNVAITKAKSAVEELQKSAETVRQSSTDAAKVPVHVVHEALAKVQDAMAIVKSQAATFDEKISSTVSGAKESISTTIESIATTARDKTTTIIEHVQEQVHKLQGGAHSSALAMAGGVANKVSEYDQYYKVSERVTQVAEAATGKAKELDDYYGVSKKAMDIDQRVTGGYGTAAVVKGSEFAKQGIDYVSETITQARAVADENQKAPPKEM